jgi:lipopolysaccharide/colanic/teichoic acid biosynthesis glycosyltransferase
MWKIFAGKISFVGSPLFSHNPLPKIGSLKSYKPGITGIVQINNHNIYSKRDAEKYHLFYIKNQSLLLDVEILIKSIWKLLQR